MLLMKDFESFSCQMRVNLRGRDICVTQKQLNHTQVGAMIQKMGSERVP